MSAIVKAADTSGEPVSLHIAKAHCRIDISTDDDLFTKVYIPSARQSVEAYTGLTLLAADTTGWIDAGLCTAHSIPLPHTPVSALSEVLAIDQGGTQTVLDPIAYGMSIAYRKMRAVLMSEVALPGGVALYKVSYTVGFGDACPPNLLLGMLELVGDAYENREAQQSGVTVQANPRAVALLDPFRITFGV
ncbi:putative phiE125 gp8 family phage protein [Paraburkholderia sp. BL8N3]|nr:phage head-tail connector protein [Paraburkholderia sp. BL8N3]TCK37977.1 putative phiE125 gp8 family phage protein [Paraburkholderia sp. BL8N3]